MESITIKVDKGLGKEMEKAMKPVYSTKSEFIREAIRDKISAVKLKKWDSMSREELIQIFMSFRGKAKKHVSDKELHKAREQALKELVKEKGWD